MLPIPLHPLMSSFLPTSHPKKSLISVINNS